MESLKIDNIRIPLDRYYYINKKAHLWVKVDGVRARVGFDQFITENAGYLNYLTISGSNMQKGQSFGYYESAKFVSKLFAPVSGEIVARNKEIMENPRKVNEDPYGSWIVEVEMSDDYELQDPDILKESMDIEKWMGSEFKRMADDE